MNRSWQILTFSPRIVVFVRICGTHNTANEVFHCVHFECPCKPDVLKLHMNEQTSDITTEERQDDNVTYEEFYKYCEPFIDKINSNSSTIHDNSPMEPHTILPFKTKQSRTEIFPIQQIENGQN